MQTGLKLCTLVVLQPHFEYRSVVPPQKPSNDCIEQPRNDDHAPLCLSKHIGRCNIAYESRRRIFHTLGQVDWDQYSTPKDGEDYENISAHLQDSEEDHRIQTNQGYQILFFRSKDRSDPGEHALSHRRRRMFLICDLELWCVN